TRLVSLPSQHLKAHQVGRDLLEPAFAREEVEGNRHQLVYDRHRRRILGQVYRQQVAAADLAGVHAEAGEALAVGVDGKPPGVLAAAGRADQARIDPALVAAAAEQAARRTDQRFAR